MSVEQGIFAIASTACIVGAVVAVASRDPRTAGAALFLVLLTLAALYATLAAPLVAGIVVIVTLLIVLPLAVHLSVPAPRVHPAARPPIAAAALVIAAALLVTAVLAVAAGELPLNVSLRSTDGYDVAGLRDLTTGRMAVAAAVVAAALLAALASVRSVRRAS